MTVVSYAWDPIEDNVTAEFDSQGNQIARYVTEPERVGNVISQRRDGQDSYFHHDGIGNTTQACSEGADEEAMKFVGCKKAEIKALRRKTSQLLEYIKDNYGDRLDAESKLCTGIFDDRKCLEFVPPNVVIK